jgi:N utilization substance protein B
MGSRSTSRRLAMQAIFQSEASRNDINTALENLFDEEKLSKDVKEFATILAVGVEKEKENLDVKIEKTAKNWSLDRMSLVNKSILRLALYELAHEKDTKKAVIINEAMMLAKRYSDEESAKFINGVLDAAVI